MVEVDGEKGRERESWSVSWAYTKASRSSMLMAFAFVCRPLEIKYLT
jgi:hypothetical protein